MPKKISLLPAEIKKQNQAYQQRMVVLAIASVVLAVVVGVAGVFSLLSINARSELRAIRQQKTMLEQRIAALQSYETMRQEIAAAQAIVREVTKGRPDWTARIQAVSDSLPYGIWLTELTAGNRTGEAKLVATGAFSVTTSAEEFTDIQLKGWALDQKLLTAWLAELKTLPGLSECRLGYTRSGEYQSQAAIQFAIIIVPKADA